MLKILLVEDDLTLNQNISDALKAEQFRVTNLFDGKLAERVLQKEVFDCIVLDINLPGKNGFDLCKDFRLYNKNTPVLILTAFGDLEDRVNGFNCGADDYVTKPFYMRELMLRIQALIKRNKKESESHEVLKSGDLIVNKTTKKVNRQDKEIVLTPREFQLLVKLMEKNGDLVSKNELVQEIWGNIVDANTNTIEVYINFLRNKLDKPFGKNSIKTKVGFGYYFEDTHGD